MAYKDMQKRSQAITRSNDHNKQTYDRISLMLPKGERERIQNQAQLMGCSVNRLIIDCVYKQYPFIQSQKKEE